MTTQPDLLQTPPPRLALALGSGSARGWAHIGVLRALQAAGLEPDIVCGTSVGALVGAVYAAGELDCFEDWARSLTWQRVVGLLDVGLNGGLIKGRAITELFRRHFRDHRIEALPRRFAAVATALGSGREVWLQQGPLIDAVRASMAFPGLFAPLPHEGELLTDGGLVNPVPVSLCRALGAELVIAVDLNADLLGRRTTQPEDPHGPAARPVSPVFDLLQRGLGRLRSGPAAGAAALPSLIDVLTSSVNIMQVRITRSRLAGEPADVLLRPRLAHLAFMDFHRADAAIAEGRRAVEAALPELQALLQR